MNGLTGRSGQFEFGENWKDYSKTIDQRRIDAAIADLQKLLPDGVRGKTVLDIGCGSGIHALAALSLGASSVAAVIARWRHGLCRRFNSIDPLRTCSRYCVIGPHTTDFTPRRCSDQKRPGTCCGQCSDTIARGNEDVGRVQRSRGAVFTIPPTYEDGA
jgi:hypothetical protein